MQKALDWQGIFDTLANDLHGCVVHFKKAQKQGCKGSQILCSLVHRYMVISVPFLKRKVMLPLWWMRLLMWLAAGITAALTLFLPDM